MLFARSLASSLFRHYPFHRGYEKLGLSKPFALLTRDEHYALVRLRNGMQMLVYGKDHIGRIVMLMGDFEPKISYVARALIGRGDLVLDIGSNMGWFSLVAAPLAKQVHAFEPQPRLNALFHASLAMNGIDNVTVHDIALSDEDGTADLHILKGNLGAGRLSEETGAGWSKLTIATRNAQTYLDGLALGKVRLVKIDVEGHEATVFGNALGFLGKSQPDAIIFESASDTDFFERPVVQLLQSAGYRIFSLGDGWRAPRFVERKRGDYHPTIDHLALLDGPRMINDLKALGIA